MKVLLQETSSRHKLTKTAVLICGVCVGLGVFGGVLFHRSYNQRFYPGVTISTIPVGGLTFEQAQDKLLQTITTPAPYTIQIQTSDQSVASSSSELGLSPDFTTTLNQAYQLGRNQSFFKNLRTIVSTATSSRDISLAYTLDPVLTEKMVEALAQKANENATDPSLSLARSGVSSSLSFQQGVVGYQIDNTQTIAKIAQSTPSNVPVIIDVPLYEVGRILSEAEQDVALERAKKFIGTSIVIHHDKTKNTLNDREIISFLSFSEPFDQKKISARLEKLATTINRAPQNAVFDYDKSSLRVTAFQPSRQGITVDINGSSYSIIQALYSIENNGVLHPETDIIVSATNPDVDLTETNTLGINERIGFGESYYDHSIPTRIANVALASSRINNTLVLPGKEFSFNVALGEVSRETGFQPAYVISQGQTVLGDGGGVCQVSTTLFRALLDSGLHITRRLPHSYRVSYYELNREPGFDATVYSGDTDLRFINDTEHAILLHFTTDSARKYMTVEIFGTSDGRTVEISDYQKWGARSAPPPVYFDDPTLPAGKLIQTDWAVGGIRTKFTYTVHKDGKVLHQKEFASNYIPWSAKYRRGTGS